MKNLGWFILVFFLPVAVVFGADALPEKIDYNRDIKPILSNNCFACHGPDAKQVKGGLRLDSYEAATKELKGGIRAIVPKDVEESELVYRIHVDDPDERMPPSDSNKGLEYKRVLQGSF